MTDWPFDNQGFPKPCPWEVFMRNNAGEWETVDAFETEQEAKDFVRDCSNGIAEFKIEKFA